MRENFPKYVPGDNLSAARVNELSRIAREQGTPMPSSYMLGRVNAQSPWHVHVQFPVIVVAVDTTISATAHPRYFDTQDSTWKTDSDNDAMEIDTSDISSSLTVGDLIHVYWSMQRDAYLAISPAPPAVVPPRLLPPLRDMQANDIDIATTIYTPPDDDLTVEFALELALGEFGTFEVPNNRIYCQSAPDPVDVVCLSIAGIYTFLVKKNSIYFVRLTAIGTAPVGINTVFGQVRLEVAPESGGPDSTLGAALAGATILLLDTTEASRLGNFGPALLDEGNGTIRIDNAASDKDWTIKAEISARFEVDTLATSESGL